MTEQTEQTEGTVTEVDTENLPDVAPDDDEVFEAAIKEEPEGSESGGKNHQKCHFPIASNFFIHIGSGGDVKSPDSQPPTAVDEPVKEELLKRSFRGFTAKMDAQKPKEEDSRPSTPKRKEALLQQYYALMKEKRDLRKRNAQAQTNICQYLRKHNIDLFSHLGADKSQV